MKRKLEADDSTPTHRDAKASKSETNGISNAFHPSLFERSTVDQYSSSYGQSEPYKHAVVHQLMSDTLLRSVRQEILDNIHFTPKETDIYKIHQSGDLANLSGLSSSALKRLPSLLELRDALYSAEFRAWISEVSGAGSLSGKKTDMAVNVYAPGCHLLCHDDVIGSRRVSYILYLTDPDRAWKDSWGGALRLYPTHVGTGKEGKKLKMPNHQWTKLIPPAWNQLSFFAVQPGESFHDVEEVYKREQGDAVDDGGRVRMAISGWFHIPQEGEEGFEPGLEEELAERSSLQQLQGKNDELDLPKTQWIDYGEKATSAEDDEAEELREDELDFLLKFLTPHYLTPDTVEELSELFSEESSLQLTNILSKKFSAALRDEINKADEQGHLSGEAAADWQTARPPHKHRYLFKQPGSHKLTNGDAKDTEERSAYSSLLNELLPSLAFRKWLSLVTGLTLVRATVLARRFRKGLDYSLATAHEGDDAHLEWCINMTPSKGWGADETEEGSNNLDEEEANGARRNGKSSQKQPEQQDRDEEDNVGGYEVYMAGDDADDDDDEGSDHGVEIPTGSSNPSATGGGNRRLVKQKKADPAVYKAATEDEDDGILFSNPAAWNTMSIVLRDKGTLKFVKYVSQAAQGDRWDITGNVEVLDDEDDEIESDVDEIPANGGANDHGEEWNGIED